MHIYLYMNMNRGAAQQSTHASPTAAHLKE